MPPTKVIVSVELITTFGPFTGQYHPLNKIKTDKNIIDCPFTVN